MMNSPVLVSRWDQTADKNQCKEESIRTHSLRGLSRSWQVRRGSQCECEVTQSAVRPLPPPPPLWLWSFCTLLTAIP